MIERYRDVDVPRFFRGDAAFTIPELYDLLEADGYEYEIRLKANAVLERHVGHLLTRPVGRTPKRPQRFYHSFDANEAWLQLHVLAYNLGNFLRRSALPPSVKQWSLTTLRDKLIKIGATVVHHGRYVTSQLAEVAVPRRLYRAILERIRRVAALSPRAVPI